MLSRLRKKSSNSKSKDKLQDEQITPAPTNRLIRYSERPRFSTSSFRPTSANGTAHSREPSATSYSTDGSIRPLEFSGGDITRTQSQTSAQRYKTNILQKQEEQKLQDSKHLHQHQEVDDEESPGTSLRAAPSMATLDAAAAPAQQPANGNVSLHGSSTPLNGSAAGPTRKVQLNAYQRHYLIKALVAMQMANDARELEKLGGLTYYGHPFSRDRPELKRIKKDLLNEYTTGLDSEDGAKDTYAGIDEDAIRRSEGLQEPVILRHMFHAHLYPFPGLKTAPLKFWQQRIQVFLDEMAAHNFSTSLERAELTKRRFFALEGIRYLSGFFARGVGVRGPGELPGPGPGVPGSDKWGVGKQWGKGTVKRGLDKPIRIDDKLMAQIDALFTGEEGKQWQLAGKEALRVRKDWQAFKEHTIEHEDGIDEVIRNLDINNLKNLPPRYRNAEEWARNHAAYMFHSLFVANPDSDSLFKILKTIHSLFPYWGAKQLLKYANAQVMIQGILGLMLARPAGAKSLIQRIFSFIVSKEISTIEKEYIAPIKRAITEKDLAQLVEDYVKRGSRPEKRAIRAKTLKTGNDIVTIIVLEGNHAKLSADAQRRILDLQRAYGLSNFRSNLSDAYPTGTPLAAEGKARSDSGLSGDDARKATQFALLKLLLRECLKKRDREEASKIASGSLIPTIIKDALENVFYEPIKLIASTADLSNRLGDLQAFLDDLIETKKKGDDSLQAWIALTARHENSLYYLFHECAHIAGPFFDWLQLGADYMALSTSDPSNPADRSKKNIEVNVEEMLSDPRLSDSDVTRILKEVDSFTQYTLWNKVNNELEHRKNFILSYPDAPNQSELGVDNVPSEQFKRDVQDIDGMLKRLMEQNGVKRHDGLCRSEVRGTEMADYPYLYFDDVDPLGQHLMGEEKVAELRYNPRRVSAPPPAFLHTRKVLPKFQEILLSEMPDWRGVKPAQRRPATRSNSLASGSAATVKNKAVDGQSVRSKMGFKLPFFG